MRKSNDLYMKAASSTSVLLQWSVLSTRTTPGLDAFLNLLISLMDDHRLNLEGRIRDQCFSSDIRYYRCPDMILVSIQFSPEDYGI